MNLLLYLYPFIVSFSLAVIFIAILLLFSDKMRIASRKSLRHIHKQEVLRIGGAAIIAAFILAMFMDKNLVLTQQLWGIIIAGAAIFAVGLWDDFRELDWKTQLFFQIAIIIFSFIMGIHVEYITNPFGGILLLNYGKIMIPALLIMIVWMVVIMNAMNWVDGIDGLSGGITLIGLVTIMLLSLKPHVNQPPIAIVSAIVAGAILAFLIYNFHPAKIMAGTSGSMFMGYILAVLAVVAGAKIATALLVTCIPIIDSIWVIVHRIKEKKSIFEADKSHLHHRLLELGWSQKQICLFFYSITALVAFVALNTKAMGKLVSIALVMIVMMIVLILITKKSNSEYANIK